MISKDLKVGETFEDGGRTYVVKEVLPTGGYISEVTEKKAEPIKTEATHSVSKTQSTTKKK